jgi:hypothetical protein
MKRISLFVLTFIIPACGPSWDACKVDVAGTASCVENGSAFQESDQGFDDCEDEGGTVVDGTCADAGFGCAGDGDAGLFVADASCAP